MFSLPTCPLRSAPRTILSSFDILSINPSRSSQKSFFTFMLLLTCGAYALTIFRMDPFTSSFMAISLSDSLFTSRTLSVSSSLSTIPIPFFLPSAPLYNSLHPPPMFLVLLPFHFVSYRHNMSKFLCSIKSASSLHLPVIVPIFKVSTLMSERLLFHTSLCFFTRLPPLFLLLFSLCLAVAQFPQVPCCATPEAVVGNPGRDRSGMD